MKTIIRGQRSEVRSQKSESGVRRPSSVVWLQGAFTLVELLVVISIMALLLGIIVPSYFSIREKAKYTKAKVTAKNLETAFKAYLDQYRTWPTAWTEDPAVEIKDNVMKILRGDPGMSENQAGIAFYEFESTNISEGAIDPLWDTSDVTTKRAYLFKVDKDYNNSIDVGGTPVYRTVLVWSCGTNHFDDGGTGDDVKSWD